MNEIADEPASEGFALTFQGLEGLWQGVGVVGHGFQRHYQHPYRPRSQANSQSWDHCSAVEHLFRMHQRGTGSVAQWWRVCLGCTRAWWHGLVLEHLSVWGPGFHLQQHSPSLKMQEDLMNQKCWVENYQSWFDFTPLWNNLSSQKGQNYKTLQKNFLLPFPWPARMALSIFLPFLVPAVEECRMLTWLIRGEANFSIWSRCCSPESSTAQWLISPLLVRIRIWKVTNSFLTIFSWRRKDT